MHADVAERLVVVVHFVVVDGGRGVSFSLTFNGSKTGKFFSASSIGESALSRVMSCASLLNADERTETESVLIEK